MMDKVSAYSFGSVEVTVSEDGTSSHTASTNTPLLLTHEALITRVQPMEAEILRLKSLCLVFAERLAQLEGSEGTNSGGVNSNSNGVNNNSELKSPGSSKSHMQHSPSLAASKSGSGALKRRLSEDQMNESNDSNNNNSDSRAHKKKRT